MRYFAKLTTTVSLRHFVAPVIHASIRGLVSMEIKLKWTFAIIILSASVDVALEESVFIFLNATLNAKQIQIASARALKEDEWKILVHRWQTM